LWKFYARREEYLPAAKALLELASRPSDMSLHERTYYLAQALASAKSAASLGLDQDGADVEFTNGLIERCEVAQVQVEVLRGIQNSDIDPKEKAAAIERLNSDLLGLDEVSVIQGSFEVILNL
jgi:nuclear pore complex protein Nup155